MKKITATSEQIAQHEKGPIVAVAFGGKCPPGSQGNECAEEMVTYLRTVLGTTDAAGILFDFRDLDYTWGDAIGGLALALKENAATFRPSAIVATGGTAQALQPLLSEGCAFGTVGTKMFASKSEAITHLEGMLGKEGC